ncbi:hypothetical protein [Williamsia muralis]
MTDRIETTIAFARQAEHQAREAREPLTMLLQAQQAEWLASQDA